MESQADTEKTTVSGVVVGVDGSEAAQHALAWAVDKTATFGEVTPITAVEPPILARSLPGPMPRVETETYRLAAEEIIKNAVLATDPSMAKRAQAIESDPGVGLIAASANANLLVVGTRGRRAITATVLGSVSSYCAAHSTVPLVVVPPGCRHDKPLSRILVGVDTSENAKAALQWSIDNAAPNATIDAIAAVPTWGGVGAGFDPPREVLQDRLDEILHECVDQVTGDSYQGPKIRITPIPEDVTYVMRKLADERFDLLVLGQQGSSGLHHLLFGSVSSALVHHPRVPTVIVPGS